jgi:hypothetical protein
MPPIPHEPHPDVAIVRHVLAQLQRGESVPREAVAKAIGLEANDPVVARRALAARNQLRREGIVIEAANGRYVRLDDAAILTRHAGRERKGIGRKARKAGEKLAAIDATKLPEPMRAEYFAERTINNVVYRAAGSDTKKKLLGAVAVAGNTLPMAQAIRVLTASNGDQAAG